MRKFKRFELAPLDTLACCLFASLFLSGKLKPMRRGECLSMELMEKFFGEWRIAQIFGEEYVMIRIETERPDTWYVRPILAQDYYRLVRKSEYLKDILDSLGS